MRKPTSVFEIAIQIVIFYSLVTYFAEMEFGGTEYSRQGNPFFLWSERIVAAVFTVEYLIRWIASRSGLRYPFTPLALVDLLAVLPFYLGFLVDLRSLRLIRSLRVLRLFKLYRYNAALQSFVASYRKVKQELAVLGTAVLFLVFLSGSIMFEAERNVQPTAFAKYSDGIWWSFVTLSTVGYGDQTPVTTTGRIVTCITLILGLGLFGAFISVLGGAFMSTLNQKKRERPLSARNLGRLAGLLGTSEDEVSDDEANRLIERAIDCYEQQGSAPTRPFGEVVYVRKESGVTPTSD